MRKLLLAGLCATATYGCAAAGLGGPGGSGGGGNDAEDARWAALADTTVCVVDRGSETGLREIAAKRDAAGAVLLRVGDRIEPLEQVHPVGLLAGYAGNESWVRSGDAVAFQGRSYLSVPGERRVRPELLRQAGEYRAIPVFADPSDEAPLDALYLPSRPGCVFRAYVRDDLMRR